MKYCVSARQSANVLKKADEIKVKFEDIDAIINFIEEYPDKTVIYEIPNDKAIEEVQWHSLQVYADKINLKVALGNLKLINKCVEHNLKYYWAFPITSYYELKGLLDLDVCEIFLGIPLCFDLGTCSKYNIPIRVVANLAYDAYIPQSTGINGFYIRPEDLDVYEKYISSIEFVTDDLGKESTLLHVYKDNKQWPGNLNLLITNLKENVDNRAIPEEFGKTRVNCQQKCMRNNSCHFCESAFYFATEIRKEVIKHNKEK